jgi:hypothetical protein
MYPYSGAPSSPFPSVMGTGTSGAGYGGYSSPYPLHPNNNSNNGAPGGNDYAFANNDNSSNSNYGSSNDDDDDKYGKKKNKNRKWKNGGGALGWGASSSSGLPNIVILAVGFVYCVTMTALWFAARGRANHILKELNRSSLSDVVDHVRNLTKDSQTKETRMKRAEREAKQVPSLERTNKYLLKERDEWKAKFDAEREKNRDPIPHQVRHQQEQERKLKDIDHQRLTRREGAFLHQIEWLIASTRRESKRSVLERYACARVRPRRTAHDCQLRFRLRFGRSFSFFLASFRSL